MSVPSESEVHRRLLQEERYARSPHLAPSHLTAPQRATWRLCLPHLIGLYAHVFYASHRRGRLRPGEGDQIEEQLANWDRCTDEQLERLQARLNELHGLYQADLQLAACSAEPR
jgi:hypothetical protein